MNELSPLILEFVGMLSPTAKTLLAKIAGSNGIEVVGSIVSAMVLDPSKKITVDEIEHEFNRVKSSASYEW